MQVFSVHKQNYLSRNSQVLPCQPCQRQVLLLLGFPPVQRDLVSHQRYLMQQLRNSFANVKISKTGELINLALSITIIVRFVDVKQSFFLALEHQPCLWQPPPPLLASPARLSSCASTPPCCSPWGLSTEGRVQSPGGESRRPHCCCPSQQSPQELPPCDVFDVNMIQIWTALPWE